MSDSFRGRVADYLSRNPVTGLLIAKDDRILFEQYQYGRIDRDLLISQSMVKSITGILVGIAISEGAIKSVDDTTETYVPGFKGTEYGRTTIRDLLHMSSGVEFGEERDNERDLNRLWNDMIVGGWDFQKDDDQQYYAIQPADRAARDEIFLRQHRAGRARRRAPLRRQQNTIGLSARQGLGADRHGSRRQMAGRCARSGSGGASLFGEPRRMTSSVHAAILRDAAQNARPSG
jgi:hypothetical protein